MTEARPNPERLLQQVQEQQRQAERGKLKIYLGAAPGVGKTYEMLSDALEQRAKGLDVVAGIIESHGRKEIDQKLESFLLLPKKTVEYRGKKLKEFDLDAALKRHPGLLLIDEMAHSNAPGLRHDKRWQDIKELLDRGIDVWTTLNVQHIESLNDDVAQIVGTAIKETVPDRMIEMANTIELVDLPPEALINRLREGKVYFPAQANLAEAHFFREANLAALRELALRVTADRVGAEVLLHRQGEGIKPIWSIQDKILVCVGPNVESLKLIRAGKRMANSLQAEWIAVYIETPRLQASEKSRSRAIQHLRLAEQLGAQTRVLSGIDIVQELLNFAQDQNISQIMIWKHIRSPWLNWLHRNTADKLLRRSGDIDVYIMTGSNSEEKSKWKAASEKTALRFYALAVGVVGLATGIGLAFTPMLQSNAMILLYLMGSTSVAVFGRTGPALLAALMSVLCYDFFFLDPEFQRAFWAAENLLPLLLMFLVTQTINYLTILVQHQARSARQTQHLTSFLYNLSRQLSNTRGIDSLLQIGTQYLANNFDAKVLAFLPKNSHLEVHPRQAYKLEPKEQSIAQWVCDLGQLAGLGTDTLNYAQALFVPLLSSTGSIGVLRIQPRVGQLFSPEQLRLIEACAGQIALALEVDRLQEKQREKELQTALDDVRSNLLQAFAHDLRTPLAAVLAQASALIQNKLELEAREVKKIGRSIYRETDQLRRLINNLLQITYLEAPAIKLEIKPTALEELIRQAIKQVSGLGDESRIQLLIPEKLPKIPCDPVLIQEVIVNLLDNALKFSPKGEPIELEIIEEKTKIRLDIKDRGPGIMQDEEQKLFEKFYRGRLIKSERGLGLGLAICKKIITAHNGSIGAKNREDAGVNFWFSLLKRVAAPSATGT